MGCGDSKSAVIVPGSDARTTRQKTPSISSSSGVSSYRHSHSLQQGEGPGSQGPQDFNQNTEDQDHRESDAHLRLAEQQKREAELEEERRLREQAVAEEEERRRQQQVQAEEASRLQAEEARRQEEEASGHTQGQQGVLSPPSQNQSSEQTGSGGRCFTPQEIAQHNAEVGWVEWIPHKGKVYDGNGVRSHFPAYVQNRPAMLQARARQRAAEGAEEEETEFVTFVNPIVSYWMTMSVTDPQVWRHNGILVLRFNGISEEEISKELPPFLLGTITHRSGPAYFDSLRKEVAKLLEDLQTQSDDSKNPIMQDYVAQLSRWHDKYKKTDPIDQSTVSDGTNPNEKCYPMPVDPESLRLYLLEGEPLDFEIPPEGAWQSCEPEDIDLGEPHEIFSSSLRINFATEELVFNIEGEAAWDLLLDNVIKEDVMTPEQQDIQAAREKRTDLKDPERMKRRREELRDYFIETRELAPDVVMSFLQWASVLEASQAQLDKLCEGDQ